MANEGISGMIISFILVGLFALAFITFIYQTSLDNNPQSELLTEPVMNQTFNSLNETLNSYQTIAEEQKNLTFSENPLIATFGLVSFAIVGAGRIFSNIIMGTFNIITTMLFNVIGIPPIIFGIIFTIIIITVVFLLWRNWRQGS